MMKGTNVKGPQWCKARARLDAIESPLFLLFSGLVSFWGRCGGGYLTLSHRESVDILFSKPLKVSGNILLSIKSLSIKIDGVYCQCFSCTGLIHTNLS